MLKFQKNDQQFFAPTRKRDAGRRTLDDGRRTES